MSKVYNHTRHVSMDLSSNPYKPDRVFKTSLTPNSLSHENRRRIQETSALWCRQVVSHNHSSDRITQRRHSLFINDQETQSMIVYSLKLK